jgi:phosphate transport system substrate-binding protein
MKEEGNMFTSSYKKSRRHRSFSALFLLVLCTLVAACGSDVQSTDSAHGASCPSTSQLQGTGSTFDAPLFHKLFSVYPTVPCGITVNYYPLGSAAGIAQLLNQLVDFGATDAPLTNRQLASSPNGAILHVPVTLGVVAVSYHLAEVSVPLRLTGAVLSAIYQGSITSWDDAAIAQLNPGVSLPHRAIAVLHRSDGSGTTAIFTHYLAAVSPAWKSRVGAGTSVTWPVGQGEKGSEGVAEALSATEGALGYVEYSYVVSHHLAAALLENAAGTFLAPSIAGAQAV